MLNGTGSFSVVSFSSKDGVLIITDSNPEAEHYFKYKKDAAWVLYDDATDTEKASAIGTDAVNADTAEGTVIKLSGGVITGGSGSSVGGGITVYIGGTVTLSGGNITGNKAVRYGGGVFIGNNATFTLSEGRIYGNSAAEKGGGVYASNNQSDNDAAPEDYIITYILIGGMISGNSSVNGAGIYSGTKGIKVGGNIKVKDNTADENPNDIEFSEGILEFSADPDHPLAAAGTDKADIRINRNMNSGFSEPVTLDEAAARAAACFTLNGEDKVWDYDSSEGKYIPMDRVTAVKNGFQL